MCRQTTVSVHSTVNPAAIEFLYRLKLRGRYPINCTISYLYSYFVIYFFPYLWSCSKLLYNGILPIREHCGGVLVGIIWPNRQVALLPPFLTWSAGQVRVISTPWLTGKAGSVTTLLHVEFRVLHSVSESKHNLVNMWTMPWFSWNILCEAVSDKSIIN